MLSLCIHPYKSIPLVTNPPKQKLPCSQPCQKSTATPACIPADAKGFWEFLSVGSQLHKAPALKSPHTHTTLSVPCYLINSRTMDRYKFCPLWDPFAFTRPSQVYHLLSLLHTLDISLSLLVHWLLPTQIHNHPAGYDVP